MGSESSKEEQISWLCHCIGHVKAEKEALKKVPPSDLFRHETDKYSKFDDKVKALFMHVDCLSP